MVTLVEKTGGPSFHTRGTCCICKDEFSRHLVIRLGSRPKSQHQVKPRDGTFLVQNDTIDLTHDPTSEQSQPSIPVNVIDIEPSTKVVILAMCYDRDLMEQ